jgi:hypothetical protein
VPAAVKKPAAASAKTPSNPLLEEKRPKNFGARRQAGPAMQQALREARFSRARARRHRRRAAAQDAA